MQPPTTTEEPKVPEVCPKCGSDLAFEKDGKLELYVCTGSKNPKSVNTCYYKYNLKKEQWKKDYLSLKPTPLPEVHESCDFCKNKHSDKCPDAPTAKSCSMYEENKNISYADKIVMLIDNKCPAFFKDQYKNCYVLITDNKIQKTLHIHSDEFKQLCIDRFYRTFGKVPKSDSIKDAICAFEAISRNQQTINLRTRINMLSNPGIEIWIDRCDVYCQSIKITANKYELIEKTPPLFRQQEHMKELPRPIAYDGKCGSLKEFCTPPSVEVISQEEGGGGENSCNLPSVASLPSFKYLFRIFDYLRVPKDDQILIISAIVSYFFVGYPYVCIYIHGSSGKGKSVGSKCVRKLIDPTTIEDIGLPKKAEELLQKVDHHYFCCFDNVGYISDEFSDIFCRVSTGGGMSKRKLYTDDADFYRQLKRPLWFNGISVEITREDLLKRTILCEALPLVGAERTEEEIFKEFEEIRPYIIHDLYRLVSIVIKKLSTIIPSKLFRMADYTKIGCATSEALGYDQQFFLDAYETKLTDQVKELIWNNTVGSVLYDFVTSSLNAKEWKGTPTDLFKLIKAHAKDEMGVSTRARDFPKSPPHLTRKINLLSEAFQKIGIELVHTEGTIRQWHIINHNFKTTDQDASNDSERYEKLCQYIRTEKLRGSLNSEDIEKKIAELSFADPLESIMQHLRDDGIITGADQEF